MHIILCIIVMPGYTLAPFNMLIFSGSFTDRESSAGFVTCLNIWSGVISSETLLAFSQCRNYGDIFHLDDQSGSLHGLVTADFTSGKQLEIMIRCKNSGYFPV